MRIALIYPFFHTRGGIERYVVELAHYLNAKHDVSIVCNNWDEMYTGQFKFIKIPMLTKPFFLSSLSFSVMVFFRLNYEDFDIIHTQGANSFKQHIVHAHSCHKTWFFESLKAAKRFSNAWWLKIFNPLHYLTMFTETIQYKSRSFKCVIAISENIKTELMKYHKISPDQICVVYSGVKCDEFHPKHKDTFRNQIRAKYNLKEEDLVLVFVANEFKRKGLLVLLRAIAILKNTNIKLFVIGKDNRTPYQKEARSLRIYDQVIFVGSTGTLNHYYAASDIFVFPTQYEPFGLVIIEAMAAGLPVIISKIAGAAEIIEDRKDGILIKDVFDVNEIAEHLNYLIDAKSRDTMEKLAREKAEKYSWDKVCKEIVNVYEQVVLVPRW